MKSLCKQITNVRKGCFAGGWLSKPSSIFTAALNWAKLANYFHSAMKACAMKAYFPYLLEKVLENCLAGKTQKKTLNVLKE